MASNSFDFVCFFGFSQHFVKLAELCQCHDIDYVFVYGAHQRSSIEALKLPIDSRFLCIKSLSMPDYKSLNIAKRNSIGLSFGSPFIFSSNNIKEFSGNLINSHGAPLPEFKGGGGFSWIILQRDKRGACLMHLVSEDIDEGPPVFRYDFDFSHDDRKPIDYMNRQAVVEENYLLPWLKNLLLGKKQLTTFPSPDSALLDSSYFPRMNTDLQDYINWSLSLLDIEAFILAFSEPYSGASTFIKGQKVRLMNCHIKKSCTIHPFLYGLVLSKSSASMSVACSGGVIELLNSDLKFDRDECSINQGDRFYTPSTLLHDVFSSKVHVTPDKSYLACYSIKP